MPAKLHQVLPLFLQRKAAGQKTVEAFSSLLGGNNFVGMTRRYTPIDDEGQTFPPEDKRIIRSVDEMLEQLRPAWSDMVDSAASMDCTNQKASANIVIDEQVVAENVPGTTLIFLEKKTNELINAIKKLPTLDPNFQWTKDENDKVYKADPVETLKTQKVPNPIVLYEATEKHPAQVEMQHKDVTVGKWTTTAMSKAISQVEKDTMLRKAVQLRDAIIFAREQANQQEVEDKTIGNSLFSFVFGGQEG